MFMEVFTLLKLEFTAMYLRCKNSYINIHLLRRMKWTDEMQLCGEPLC